MEVELVCNIISGDREGFITIQGVKDDVEEVVRVLGENFVINEKNVRPDNLKKDIREDWLG